MCLQSRRSLSPHVYSPVVSVTAIVPLKALANAKGRLSEALDPAQRQSFVAWMATRVIAACQACDGIDEVLVVAGDQAAADVASAAGAKVLLVAEEGLRIALLRADAVTAGREATIVVAADLPEASAADLDTVLAAAGPSGRAVVIAPTDDGGTGALLRRPPTVTTTAYGPGSAAAHADLARASGLTAQVVDVAGLAHDVDTPEHLPAALALVARDDVGCRAR